MHHPVVIIGAGPAGLTAAYELVKNGVEPIVFERGDKVEGISRTETYKGYHFDIGGHRFFTKVEEVQNCGYLSAVTKCKSKIDNQTFYFTARAWLSHVLPLPQLALLMNSATTTKTCLRMCEILKYSSFWCWE